MLYKHVILKIYKLLIIHKTIIKLIEIKQIVYLVMQS